MYVISNCFTICLTNIYYLFKLYEPLVVGKFCEAQDPYLAYIVYAKALCDEKLIAITNDNSMF
jgi:hypothetical protein